MHLSTRALPARLRPASHPLLQHTSAGPVLHAQVERGRRLQEGRGEGCMPEGLAWGWAGTAAACLRLVATCRPANTCRRHQSPTCEVGPPWILTSSGGSAPSGAAKSCERKRQQREEAGSRQRATAPGWRRRPGGAAAEAQRRWAALGVLCPPPCDTCRLPTDFNHCIRFDPIRESLLVDCTPCSLGRSSSKKRCAPLLLGTRWLGAPTDTRRRPAGVRDSGGKGGEHGGRCRGLLWQKKTMPASL